MKYQKHVGVGGQWVKAGELKSGTRAKIVSETEPKPSEFKNKDGSFKTQDVCKVRFEHLPEALNVSLNRATINALVDAFGDDSKDWQGHYLTVETEKVKVAGVTRVALYLVPEGYEKKDDLAGYTIITKIGAEEPKTVAQPEDIPVINLDEDPGQDDSSIPF